MAFIRWLDTSFEETLVTIFIGIFITASLLQVLFRFVLEIPASWTEESARYAFIWMTFVGAAVASKRSSHVRMDLLEHMVRPPALKAGLNWLAQGAFLLFCAIAFVVGVKVCLSFSARPQFSPVMKLPMICVYGAVPVGMGLSIFRIIQSMWRKIKAARSLETAGEVSS